MHAHNLSTGSPMHYREQEEHLKSLSRFVLPGDTVDCAEAESLNGK